MAKKTTTKTKTSTKKTSAKKSDRAQTQKRTKPKLSQMDAAARVLAARKKPMTCKEMVEAMAKRNLWKSPGGKTPHATLYAAILREIANKGKDARFKKVDRGLFALK